MRILYLANNWAGWQVLEFLQARGEDIAGIAMHPSEKRKYGPEIEAAAGAACIVDGSRLNQPETLETIRQLRPDIGVSVFYGYILRRALLDLLPAGCINLHPAFLPYNRGAHPNVWSIVDGTPAGATLHYIDEGVDTGDIIAQRPVPVDPTDTGETLYRKLERASLDLFRDAWPDIRVGRARRTPQPRGEGTSHRVRDLDGITEIDIDAVYPARRLIDIIRAQTFPPYRGAWFRHNGRRLQVRLAFYEEKAEAHADTAVHRD